MLLEFCFKSVIRFRGAFLLQVHQGAFCRPRAPRVAEILRAEIVVAQLGTALPALEAEIVVAQLGTTLPALEAEIVRVQIGTTRLALEAEVVFIGRYGVGGGSAGNLAASSFVLRLGQSLSKQEKKKGAVKVEQRTQRTHCIFPKRNKAS